MSNFKDFGFLPADILLPKEGTDLCKFSVVACDQYTSEPEYWESVDEFVGEAPSALRMILPEVYLSEEELDTQVEVINSKMAEYLKDGLFEEYKNSFIYVERRQNNGAVRNGLIGMVDLEAYDFIPEKEALIRATEGTVIERIPPRVRIRRKAPLELPHIMLLIDDAEKTVIEPICEKKDELVKLYDFKLMKDSGSIKGYLVPASEAEHILPALEKIASETTQKERYGKFTGKPLVFAVGDGNHSLASAKKCWENIRENLSPEEAENHPARYALVELVNVHDESLEFEAIHRVLFGCNPQKVLAAMKVAFPGMYEGRGEGHKIGYVTSEGEGVLTIPNPPFALEIATLQGFLDDYMNAMGGKLDYIHGADVVRSLCVNDDEAIGFIVPSMGKSELFSGIVNDGVLPRKTFSMGEAQDKRFYLEARRLAR